MEVGWGVKNERIRAEVANRDLKPIAMKLEQDIKDRINALETERRELQDLAEETDNPSTRNRSIENAWVLVLRMRELEWVLNRGL